MNGNSSGYGDLGNDASSSGYGSPGYGQPDNQSGYGDTAEPDSGYGTSGFEDTPGDGTASTALGAGNNPYRTRGFVDGYRGNQFEVNPFDTPYSETAANPFPQGDGYASAPSAPQVGRSRDRQVQAEELPPMTPPPQPQGVVNAEPTKSASTKPSAQRKAPKRRTYSDDQLML